jgi:4-amino-4-deoxy-L-arabinose transferase-like glycosyltransferase
MNRRQFRLGSAGLAIVAAGVTLLLATELFPYHTTNHDEAVYLQQAAMLLEGQLTLQPPVPDAFRPWFFVRDGSELYPKYSPVPAATFAVGELLGGFRLALAAIAAGNVALTVAVVAEGFDRRTGLLAGAFLLASPLFLIDSSVFLPYAPTTFWNLLFALAYFRASRREADPEASTRETRAYALLAGLAIGAAFFARPYTAVLFAAPFVVHALYSLRSQPSIRNLSRLSLTALGGLAGVAVALGYNAAVTGSPTTFPYEAFAPRDGLGFGHREILGYSREYTPELALRTNAEVVATFFTEWVVAGPLGTLLAAVGVGASLSRTVSSLDRSLSVNSSEFTDVQAKAVLAGLFVSVVAGNVYFWGNLNILGSLADPADGLVATLGPYYHFDLLLPTAAFAAHGGLLVFDRVRGSLAERTGQPRKFVALAAVVSLLLLVGATGAVLEPTVSKNAAITDEYERAYQPIEEREFSDAVVLLPTPYGDWLNHPFQHLRNDPGFDGEVVYATSGGPSDLAVASAYPNRSYYRYVYRGTWAPTLGESVDPALDRVTVARGDSVTVDATVGVPSRADRVSMRLSTDEGAAYYGVNGTPANLSTSLRVANGTARLSGSNLEPVGENASVPVGREDEVVVQTFVSDGAGGFSYRLELPVRQADGSVVALSPYREVCLVALNCDGAAAYVPDATPSGVHLETTLRANGTAEENRVEARSGRELPKTI